MSGFGGICFLLDKDCLVVWWLVWGWDCCGGFKLWVLVVKTIFLVDWLLLWLGVAFLGTGSLEMGGCITFSMGWLSSWGSLPFFRWFVVVVRAGSSSCAVVIGSVEGFVALDEMVEVLGLAV